MQWISDNNRCFYGNLPPPTLFIQWEDSLYALTLTIIMRRAVWEGTIWHLGWNRKDSSQSFEEENIEEQRDEIHCFYLLLAKCYEVDLGMLSLRTEWTWRNMTQRRAWAKKNQDDWEWTVPLKLYSIGLFFVSKLVRLFKYFLKFLLRDFFSTAIYPCFYLCGITLILSRENAFFS